MLQLLHGENKLIYNVVDQYAFYGASQWRSLGLFSSEAIHRAQRCEKMLGGVQKLEEKKGRVKRIFPSLNG